jgi:hypothetical protein
VELQGDGEREVHSYLREIDLKKRHGRKLLWTQSLGFYISIKGCGIPGEKENSGLFSEICCRRQI